MGRIRGGRLATQRAPATPDEKHERRDRHHRDHRPDADAHKDITSCGPFPVFPGLCLGGFVLALLYNLPRPTADVDYVNNPANTNKLIVELVQKYNNGWQYDAGVADYAVKTMKDLGLVGNGPDSTLGNMDPARIDKIIGIVGPALASQGKQIKDGLKASDMSTNQFIDPSIGL